MAVEPLHLRPSLCISAGCIVPVAAQFCAAPTIAGFASSGAGAGCGPANDFLMKKKESAFRPSLPLPSPFLSLPLPLKKNSLLALALLHHALDAVHGTIRTRDGSIGRNVVTLHYIAADFARATCAARFCSAALDGFGLNGSVGRVGVGGGTFPTRGGGGGGGGGRLGVKGANSKGVEEVAFYTHDDGMILEIAQSM